MRPMTQKAGLRRKNTSTRTPRQCCVLAAASSTAHPRLRKLKNPWGDINRSSAFHDARYLQNTQRSTTPAQYPSLHSPLGFIASFGSRPYPGQRMVRTSGNSFVPVSSSRKSPRKGCHRRRRSGNPSSLTSTIRQTVPHRRSGRRLLLPFHLKTHPRDTSRQ